MIMRTHPQSNIQSNRIGSNTRIWQHCIVQSDTLIGSNCNLSAHTLIEDNVIIVYEATVKSSVQPLDEIDIEDAVFIGANTTFLRKPTLLNSLEKKIRQHRSESFSKEKVHQSFSKALRCSAESLEITP
jgi:carbonic anhydrase/acetyltransferase-like protein (isoleucine patch superfamily)